MWIRLYQSNSMINHQWLNVSSISTSLSSRQSNPNTTFIIPHTTGCIVMLKSDFENFMCLKIRHFDGQRRSFWPISPLLGKSIGHDQNYWVKLWPPTHFQTHDSPNHVKLLSITIQPVVCGIINVVFGLLCLLLKDIEILETFNHWCLIILRMNSVNFEFLILEFKFAFLGQ